MDLAGKVAFVTGGSRGIGKEIAASLAAGGADVCVTSRRESDAAAVASEIAATGVPESRRVHQGAQVSHQDRAALGPLRQIHRSPRPPRPRLRLVHRGI